MIGEPQQEQAALYALGALPAAEVTALEAEMSRNPELRALVRRLQGTVAMVAGAVPTVALPPGLKQKVMQRIDALGKPRPTPVRALAPPPGLRFTTSAGQSDWKALPIPGAAIKLLTLEREAGYAVLMGKLEPGARYPAHINAGPEDFYILTGDLVVAGQPVPGEGGRARMVQRLLEDGAGPEALAGAGVGWLVVEHRTPGVMASADKTLQHLTPAYSDADITLYRIGGTNPAAPQAHRMAAIAAHLVWAAMVAASAAGLAAAGVRRRQS